MKIDVSMKKVDLIPFNISEIKSYIMVLLELSIYGYINIECKSCYYVIDSNWSEMGDKMQMKILQTPEGKY